ncbi:histidine kinase [Galactobacter sp.]|uniref:sensor histidine kinase n=1 Tax=Galactobacter sp. TaxID=2676125 RepID=UPI0025B88B48|nr:histidine kinase [Galactobacter sp.]
MNHLQASQEQDVERGGAPWTRYSWVMAALWLMFIFYPASALVSSPASGSERILGWTGLVAFVVLYLLAFRLGHNTGVSGAAPLPRTWWLFSAAVFSVLLTIPAIGDGAFSFLPFVVTIPAYQLSRWFFYAVAAVSVLGLAGYVMVTGTWAENIALLIILVVLCMVHTVTTWLIGRSVEAERLSRDLVASEERETLARDVHDLLGHSLTVVKLKAELARKLIRKDPDRAERELAELDTLVAEAISGVRATVTGLRTEGLPAQLASATTAMEQAGIAVDVRGDEAKLSAAQSLVTAWILREATTNTLRHAQASRVCIGFRPGAFSFEDDGVGLAAGDVGEPDGNGLRGMKERATVAGAELGVGVSHDLGGTRVELTW